MSTNITKIQFGDSEIGAGCPVFIIAEIGINHEGDVAVCARMVEEAVRAGANAIKLQTVDAAKNYAPDTDSYRLFSSSSLTSEETARIFQLAKSLGAEAFTTVGDFATLDWVDRLNPAGYKISSGLLTHLPLISKVAKCGRPILMSNGIAGEDEIESAINTARSAGASEMALFQCTSIYPTPEHLADLATIGWLTTRFGMPAGYSDHCLGYDVARLSVAAGATMIEKHFTFDKTRTSFDHALSLEPDQFERMVASVRQAETIMGQAEKRIASPEAAKRMRRKLVAAHDLDAGTIVGPADILVMRISEGEDALEPKFYEHLIGRKLSRDISNFSPFLSKDI